MAIETTPNRKRLASFHSFVPQLTRIVANPHFWAIFVMAAGLAIIYYGTTVINDAKFLWFRDVVFFELRNSLNDSLMLIPIIYAYVIFKWRGALIAWVLITVVMLPRFIYLSFSPSSLVINIIFAAFPGIILVYIALQQKWKEKERKTLREREAERQSYLLQIMKAHEDERQALSRELHDEAIQGLLVIANSAQSLISESPDNRAKTQSGLETLRDSILGVSENIRRMSLDLRPSVLDNLGLVPALRSLIANMNRDGKVSIHFTEKGQNRDINPEASLIIFRIVQEALNNVRRHSKAEKAGVTVDFAADSLKVVVEDNGQGFAPDEAISNAIAQGKLGLMGMHERAILIQGKIDIHSEPGKGTSVSLEVKC